MEPPQKPKVIDTLDDLLVWARWAEHAGLTTRQIVQHMQDWNTLQRLKNTRSVRKRLKQAADPHNPRRRDPAKTEAEQAAKKAAGTLAKAGLSNSEIRTRLGIQPTKRWRAEFARQRRNGAVHA